MMGGARLWPMAALVLSACVATGAYAQGQGIPKKIEKYGACYDNPEDVKEIDESGAANVRVFLSGTERQVQDIIRRSDDQVRQFKEAAANAVSADERRQLAALAADRESGSRILRESLQSIRTRFQKCIDGADQALAAYQAAQAKGGDPASCIVKVASGSGKFALRNRCGDAVNVKYVYQRSKSMSGKYTTLQPGQTTFETAHNDESYSFYACYFPQVPQTLQGACVKG